MNRCSIGLRATVGLLGAGGGGMAPGNGRFEVIFAEHIARGGTLQQLQPPGYELPIPLGTILVR
jgi:hypothetical protein